MIICVLANYTTKSKGFATNAKGFFRLFMSL